MTIQTIATITHGRYLVDAPAGEPVGLLVGFHGQAETAGIEMEHLRAIRGSRPWTLVSVQGLHRYYTRKGDVVANEFEALVAEQVLDIGAVAGKEFVETNDVGAARQ